MKLDTAISAQPTQSPARRFAAAVLGRFWRAGLRLRFLLTQQHRHNRLVVESVAGRPILVLPHVLNPVLFQTGTFLAGALNARLVPPGAVVLDMGTGSGVSAIFAAAWARRVVAVDINPEAVRCAQINTLLHRLESRVEVRLGDLFAPVAGERFDLVLFNPPYLRGTPRTLFEQALWAPDVVERFAADLGKHLCADGHALVLLSSAGDEAAFLAAFHDQGFASEVIASRAMVSETLRIYQLRTHTLPGGAYQ